MRGLNDLQRAIGANEVLPQLLKRERPGGRMLLLSGQITAINQSCSPSLGGIAFSPDTAHTWGFSRVESAEDFAATICAATRRRAFVPHHAGFCYTQFATPSTPIKTNGLLYAIAPPSSQPS